MQDYKFNVNCAAMRDGSDVQETLKAFFEADLESGAYSRNHDVKFEKYEARGEDALAVIVDGKEIGSITGDDAAGAAVFSDKGKNCAVKFGINGHDIDEYEKIIDYYKDKKFWKEEDPAFNDQEVNRAYNDLMKGIEEGAVYQAVVDFDPFGEAKIADEVEENKTDEERQRDEQMGQFVKYFKIMMPLSIVLILIGILYIIKLSLIMGVLNLLFGALGLYFSWKYTRQKNSVARNTVNGMKDKK